MNYSSLAFLLGNDTRDDVNVSRILWNMPSEIITDGLTICGNEWAELVTPQDQRVNISSIQIFKFDSAAPASEPK